MGFKHSTPSHQSAGVVIQSTPDYQIMWQEQHCSIVLTENLSEGYTTVRALDRPSTWSAAGKWEATDLTDEMFGETIPQTQGLYNSAPW